MSETESSQHLDTSKTQDIGSEFERFVRRIEYLRGPDGCPWDRAQTSTSITKNMIEEAYEAVDAIEHGRQADIVEELGDVLLQVVLQSQIAADAGEFTIADVIASVDAKMVRRHPHVFGEVDRAEDAAAALATWEGAKAHEKLSDGEKSVGLLDSIPHALPALAQAQKLSKRAVAAGFEWESTADVWKQFDEEVAEFEEAPPHSKEATEEFGDMLFTLVNVARKEKVDAETALRLTCEKFRRRWEAMEHYAAEQDRAIDDFSVEEQEELWDRAKLELKDK